jgi:hypothetical protein
MSIRRFVIATLVVAGCQRLPTLVPLSDSGGSTLEPSARIDRRASDRADDAEGEEDDDSTADEIVVSAAPAIAPPGLDGGTTSGADASVPATDAGVEASWPGEYYGRDRFAWRGPDGREMVEVDERAHTRVELAGSSGIVISIVNSATGEVICPLNATTAGAQATIRAGETCFGTPDQPAVVTDGRATLEGDRLILDFRGELESSEGEEEEDAGGEGSYHFDGRRR